MPGRRFCRLIVLALLVAHEAAADWPRWRGSQQDGISRETELLQTWPPEGPKRLWSIPIAEGYSGVSVVGDRLFTMDRSEETEAIRCFDTRSGQELWSVQYPCTFECEEGNGPRGTPTVDDERVYAVGAANVIHCCDVTTGKVLWKRDLLAEFDAPNMPWGTSTSPLVVGDRVYVVPGGPNGNSVAALDKRTGETIWKGQDDRAGYSSPIHIQSHGRSLILFFTATALSGLDPASGAVGFRYPWETQYRCNIATPIYADGRVFISSGYDQGCALVEIASAGSALEAREVYRNKEMKNHFSTCILHDQKLYGFNMAFLTCLDMASGRKEWTQRGFGRGSLTMADGKLIILGEQGNLALASPNPEGYQEISSFQPFDGRCWTVPVVCDGRLYLRGPKTLECRQLREDLGSAP